MVEYCRSLEIPAVTSVQQSAEGVDRNPLAERHIVGEIEFTPATVLPDQAATLDGNHRFTQDSRIVVATPVHALRCILGDVPGSIFPGVAKLYVDDEAVASDGVPCGLQGFAIDVSTFSEDMQVNVPTVVAPTPLDLDKKYAALLASRPETATTKSSESAVESIDIFGQGAVRLAQCQRDQSELSTGCECGDTGGDVAGSLPAAWITEAIFASIARQAEHAGIVSTTQHPAITTATPKAIEPILCIIETSKSSIDTGTTRRPATVTEDHPDLGAVYTIGRLYASERVAPTQQRSALIGVRSCFEGIKGKG